MYGIKVLPDNLISQISAGEVIERPASVIKELLDNAIDAKASTISLTIKKSGKDLISILDDGAGMSKENILLAVKRHATSKITSLEDLNNIATLGFRGEALAAIAAVSKLELFSSNLNSGLGYSIKLAHSKITHQGVVDFPMGTRVIVEDLFFNTPARLKFLKTDRTESNQIFNLLNRIIFNYPKIRFHITHKKDIQVFPAANSLLERLTRMMPSDIVESLIPINKTSSDIKLEGFIGHPSLAKERRLYQWVYVNERPIFSHIINRAIYRGFHSLLMRNQHPLYYIKVHLPPDQVDVNVHPTKKEVRFVNESLMATVIAEAVREALTSSTRKSFLQAEPYSIGNQGASDGFIKVTDASMATSDKHFTKPFSEPFSEPFSDHKRALNPANQVDNNFTTDLNDAPQNIEGREKIFKEDNSSAAIEALTDKAVDKHLSAPPSAEMHLPGLDVNDGGNFKILGQFDKYIMAFKGDNLVIFDTHATHERILYEKIKQDFINKKKMSYQVLEPDIIKLAPYEMFILDNNQDLWENLGFEFRSLGNQDFAVVGVPEFLQKHLLHKISIKDFMRSVFASLAEFDNLSDVDNYYHQVYASMACHSAVRGTEKLTDGEIKLLIDQLYSIQIDLYCPHGRPIFRIIRRIDLDKMFKRVI
ncbi:MAG: DNA mismatch repair endonuclease MutL [SAR324 cluster bacterium]|nr:DNA mismatch repair endonuclease MutL [SAR324 cluster bacterium]